MSEIDMRKGNREFRVTTSVRRDGVDYMGPTVLVTARNEAHAREQVEKSGHTVNEYFPPEEIRKR